MSRLPSLRTIVRYALISFVVTIVVIELGSAILVALADNQDAIDAAQDADFTDVEVRKNPFWSLGSDDCSMGTEGASFTVEATHPNGERVEFQVCTPPFGDPSIVMPKNLKSAMPS